MTDFSQIHNLQELEYQTDRMQRRADIQWERIDGHITFVKKEMDLVERTVKGIVTPLYNTFQKYRHTFDLIAQGFKYVGKLLR